MIVFNEIPLLIFLGEKKSLPIRLSKYVIDIVYLTWFSLIEKINSIRLIEFMVKFVPSMCALTTLPLVLQGFGGGKVIDAQKTALT